MSQVLTPSTPSPAQAPPVQAPPMQAAPMQNAVGQAAPVQVRAAKAAAVQPASIRTGAVQPAPARAAEILEPLGRVAAGAMKTWLETGAAFMEEKGRDDAHALQDLRASKTALDAINAQQEWIARRTQAYISAGFRVIAGACLQPEITAGQAAGFRLPD
jgi:hypothetical protein